MLKHARCTATRSYVRTYKFTVGRLAVVVAKHSHYIFERYAQFPYSYMLTVAACLMYEIRKWEFHTKQPDRRARFLALPRAREHVLQNTGESEREMYRNSFSPNMNIERAIWMSSNNFTVSFSRFTVGLWISGFSIRIDREEETYRVTAVRFRKGRITCSGLVCVGCVRFFVTSLRVAAQRIHTKHFWPILNFSFPFPAFTPHMFCLCKIRLSVWQTNWNGCF